jgi:type I restriction enzyme S subunit
MTFERLGRIADIRVSNVDKLSVDGEVPVRVCNYTDVYRNDNITDELPFLNATATLDQAARFGLRRGDVIITKDSETPADIGVPAFVQDDLEAVCGYHLAILRPGPKVLGRYLYYLLRSQGARDQLSVAATGVTRFGLRQDSIRDVRVPVPSLSEQQDAVDHLDQQLAEMAEVGAVLQRTTHLLSERRLGLYHQLVTGAGEADRRPTSVAWATDLPASWSEVKLTHVARLGSGHTPSRSRPEWWVDCTIPWITTGEVAQIRSDRIERIVSTRECISAAGVANSSAVVHPENTVVLCRTAASAGYSGIMGLDMATSQDFATWTCDPGLVPEYLLFCLRAMRDDLLRRLAMGSTHKTIYMPDIEALRIPLPDAAVQNHIVAAIRERTRDVDAAVDAIAAQQAVLAERRQVLVSERLYGTAA